MMLIKLVDARKGLHEKCIELFHDEKVAESIYMYLCDGLEECDVIEPERKTGKWVPCSERLPEENMWTICQNNAGAMMIGKYDIEFGWMFPAYFDATVAWMPLPKPWGGEEHE